MESDVATNRYRSRILREMNANRDNPFNSPPSSTGSHGTVSPTVSSVFSEPDGESTRKLNEEIARVTAPRNGKIEVNWEAAHRKWPEFYGMPKNSSKTAGRLAGDSKTKYTDAIESKENFAPRYMSRVLDDSTQDTWSGSKRTRAEMQPRVDNDSDMSSTFSKSPVRIDMKPETSRYAHQPRARSPLSRAHTRTTSGQQHQSQSEHRSSLHEKVNHIRKSQTSRSLAPETAASPPRQQPLHNISLKKSSPVNLNTIRKSFPSPATTDSPAQNGATARSFFMPDISHLNDFVSGTLRFNGAVKNGVPVFVKNGSVRDRADHQPPHDHAEVDAIAVPEDEEKIFVSMDMIREEICTLQEHDDLVQKYADDLQHEVNHLQSEVKRLKSRKSIDSALGSRTGSEPETAANEQFITEKLKLESLVASLQTRLDQASRKISITEVETNTLSTERDRAMTKLQEACENIGELMDKLDHREKELTSTQKKLDTTLQMRGDNDTLRHDFVNLKHENDALQLENKSLRADNHTLRNEQQTLQQEIESLRGDNNSLRREQESLISENRSLRSNARTLMTENEELRHNSNAAQQELDAAREEMENLQQDIQALEQEKVTLKEDNDSLVRHNEKYFDENKLIRRENSGFERSIHDLHDENMRLKEEVDFLKGQLDHCRPIGKEDDLSGRFSRDEEEEGMTSAFFVPDITIDINENSAPLDVTSQSNKAPHDVGTHSNGLSGIMETIEHTDHSLNEPDNTFQSQGSFNAPEPPTKAKKAATTVQGQKVAFSIPEGSSQANKAASRVANQGSKRRTASHMTYRSSFKGGPVPDADPFRSDQESTGIQSVETTQNLSVALDKKGKNRKEVSVKIDQTSKKSVNVTQEFTSQSYKASSAKSSIKPSLNKSVTIDLTTRSHRDGNTRETTREATREMRPACPALSPDARRVLDGLCEHSCKNCVVCSRISSHRGAITSTDVAEGKKRVKVSRPIPVTDQLQDRAEYTEEPTMRPSQPPGHALAMVIKGLEDEAAHMKMDLARIQARYSDLNSALGRRERKELASEIKHILKRLEVKNDQIYALYDVLEGQKQCGQAMSEEELEMTIFSITGLSAKDVSEQLTWDGILA